MLHCPFCGAPETDRIDLDGDRFLVFACTFTPQVDPALGDERIEEHLRATYAEGGDPGGAAYFRRLCDRMHFFVTKGAGAPAAFGRSGALRPRAAGSD